MKVSSKGCYALQIMVDLALHQEAGFIPLKEICKRRNIEAIKYLEQIVALLTKARLVTSMRGNNGGYKLIKSPNDYTVGEILRAVEGDLAPLSCVDNCVGECDGTGK